MPRFMVAICVLLLLGSEGASARTNRGHSPEPGAEVEIGTGDVVVSAFEREEVGRARLKSAVKVSDSGKTLPKGMLLEEADDSTPKRPAFCAWDDAAHYCLFDTDADSIFDKATISLGARPLPRISGAYAMEYEAVPGERGWKKELIYQGSSGGVARFSFREYGSDWTTPRASQELTYDLAATGPTEVVYQGAKLNILSADSNRARFKVEAGFR